MDTARHRAELSVQDLWLRYLALGGTGDAFDLDGYLQSLVTLDDFQQDVLAQALNEGLRDLYEAHRVPLSRPGTADEWDDDRLADLMEQLLDGLPSAGRAADEPRHHRPS